MSPTVRRITRTYSQNHLISPGVPAADLPQRLFLHGRGYQWYGCIHEQPGISLNEEITPSFPPIDVNIITSVT
jgi:hypothetical protein